jgi:hypothetical protein
MVSSVPKLGIILTDETLQLAESEFKYNNEMEFAHLAFLERIQCP